MKNMKTMKSSLVGKIYNVVVPYYDKEINRVKYKARPCMILYIPKDDDEYVILPISSMLNKSHMDFYFDVFLNISAYPKLKLKKDSYIRTSKQTIAYKWDIDFKHCLGDLRNDYSKLYEYILYKVRMFDTKKIENSR